METVDMTNAILAVDSHFGVYAPQTFVQWYRELTHGVGADTLEDLSSPDNEYYWEAWEDLISNATIRFPDGKTYHVYQGEDVWLIPV